MDCTAITPISAFMSTNLSSKIDSYTRLAERIVRTMGAPLINIELHQDNIFENISIACEMFTKYAGYTEEYIVFDSNLYADGKGIRLDELFSITPSFNKPITPLVTRYIALSSLPSTTFSSASALSSTYSTGIYTNQVITLTAYNDIVNFSGALSSAFTPSLNSQTIVVNSFDYDIMDYRKVIEIFDFQEGSSTGVNTLFTIEQTLAQQTYFSYAMGNYGFDLISWYTLKNWLSVREKMLAIKRSVLFDERTQYMIMYPPPRTPGSGSRFYGAIGCYVERPLRDIIKEQWVYQYALALCKISLGYVRSKYQGTTLFGGGQINANMLEKGETEKKDLEDKLYTGATPGIGDAMPPKFYVG